MFDWQTNEARRERIGREVQKAIIKASRRDQQGQPIVVVAETVEALLGLTATLLEPTPQCASDEGIERTVAEFGVELAQLIRDTREVKAAKRH